MKEITVLIKEYGKVPGLAIIQVGDREDSTVYVKTKQKAVAEIRSQVGMNLDVLKLPVETSQAELLQEIKRFNANPDIHGILVQFPLPTSIDQRAVTEAIDYTKDVDGFHPLNFGKLAKKGDESLFSACTPKGVIRLLKESGISIAGKHAVVIGRSNIVGLPMSSMLLKEDATVTTCHSKTTHLPEIIKTADILVAAIGQPEFIKGSWIKPGAVVIDVGTNAIPDNTKKSGIRWTGDIEFHTAKEVASAITPVPGGVGPMTIAMLLENTVMSAKWHLRKQ